MVVVVLLFVPPLFLSSADEEEDAEEEGELFHPLVLNLLLRSFAAPSYTNNKLIELARAARMITSIASYPP